MSLRDVYRGIIEGFVGKTTSAVEFELKELENLFALLVLGSFAGIPSPPAFISIDLLPHMEREIRVMLSRSRSIDDPAGDLFSIFDIG